MKLLLIGSLMTIFSSILGCNDRPAPVARSAPITDRTLAPSFAPTATKRSEADTMSPEKRSYLAAVKDYHDLIEHPKGHIYNVHPKERQLELCYLSAQAVIWAMKAPEFASDLNSDGERNEWRVWIDIRQHELHC